MEQVRIDGGGRLGSARRLVVTDPRTGLVTQYGWDGTSTRLAWVKEPGLAAHRITYDLTNPSTPKVSAITRDAPVAGGAPVTLGRYVYSVPLTGNQDLPDLSAAAVGTWFQAKAPVTGYAVFGPDWTGPVTGTGVDWTHADLQYADELGYTVNTASFGAGAWQVTATDYDISGNVIRELDAGAIARVRAAEAAGEELNKGQVDALSTQTLYREVIDPATGRKIADAGILVTDIYGPARNAALADGTVLPVRPHTHTDYDQNAPDQGNGAGINPHTGEPWRLPTTVTTGVADAGAAADGGGDLEIISTTVNDYAKLDPNDTSEGDGWTLGIPPTVTTGGVTRTTRYDGAGRVTQTRQPMSNGNDADTTLTSYYTADATDPACGGKPEWAGLVCRTAPAAPPSTTGTPAAGPAVMPDQHIAAYSMWLTPASVVETSGTATRTTTTTTFDDAGRPTATWVTATIPGSTARPGTYTKYNPTTGLVEYTGTLNTARNDADPTARITTGYDLWGRVVTVTNDLREITTTTYDSAGRVASVTDPTGTTTYGYDGTDTNGQQERRGLTTSISITRAGTAGPLTVTGAYDAAGNLTTQRLPGGITQHTGYDEAGEPGTLTYTGQITPVTETTDPETGETTYAPGTPRADQPWLAWTITNDALGRVRAETTGPAAAFDGLPGVSDPTDITAPTIGRANPYERQYEYDGVGRLIKVSDHTTTQGGTASTEPCVTREYGFDKNGRRSSLVTTTHRDGDCNSTADVTGNTATYAYDTADRPTTGANGTGTYTYDAFGRQTLVPAGDAPDPAGGNITIGYYDDDLARAITQGTTTTEFALDSAGRRLHATTTTERSTTTLTRHYTDTSDNPAWTEHTTALGGTTVTRYAETIGGDLGLTIDGDGTGQLTLANPHGDIATTVTIPASAAAVSPAQGIDGWSDYTEYGSPQEGGAGEQIRGPAGYGWLGAKQRSTTAETAGLTLMGARLYNPTRGGFTSTDPIPGGNDTAYSYPSDPVNDLDLDGKHRRRRVKSWDVRRLAKQAWKRTARYQSHVVSGAAYAYSSATGARCRRIQGMMTCRGGFGHLYARGGTTWGSVYVTGRNRNTVTPSRIRHEKRHTRQWRRYGYAFPLLYGVAQVRGTCRNRYERQAGFKDGGYRC